MIGGMYPPVLFEVKANVVEALAGFNKVNASLKAMEAQAAKTGVALSRMTKTAVIATAAFKGLAIVAVGFAAIGVKEFSDLEKSMTQLGRAMANAGVNTKENRKAVEESLVAYEKLAFDAHESASAFSILIASTGSLEKSNKYLSVAADLARVKQMSLAEAARTISRASQGSARAFKEFGITLDASKPKAVAAEEAIDKLAKKLSGQAADYVNTFRGQLSLLGVQLQNIAEAVGAKVTPVLTAFLKGIQKVFGWVGKTTEAMAALAAVITGVVIVAVVALTKKLYTMAAAWLAANWEIVAVVAAIAAVVAGFIWAWNHSEKFREAIVALGKAFVYLGEFVVRVTSTIANGFLLIVRGTANAQIALGKLMHNENMVKEGKKTLDWIDSTNAGIKKLIEGFSKAYPALDKLKDKQIDFKLKLPDLSKLIPDFVNGTQDATDSVDELSDALINAKQRVTDFNIALKDTAKTLKDTWAGIVGKDVKSAIQEGLLNPVDKLIVQAQKAVDTYQAASNKYNASLASVTAAQNAYVAAVQSGNKELIASTESALGRAEDAANALADTMQKQLEDVAKLQDDMIAAIVDSYNQIAELEKKRTEVLENASVERKDLEKNYLRDTAKLRKQYDKDVLNAQQEAAKRSAEIVKQSVDQLRGIYKTATYRSIGDIFSGLTFGGLYAKGGTTEKILSALGLQTSKAKRLGDDAATLAGLGFSQTFIEEVVAQGPDVGHQLAQTIIKSSPESIVQMRAYWEELQKTSSHGVDLIANQLNKGVVLATEELTAQLAQVGYDLNAQLAEYNETLQTELTDAFTTYSEALDKINIATAKQISEIDAQIATLQSRIAQLQYALSQLATLSAPGTVAKAPTLAPSTQTDNTLELLKKAEEATKKADAAANALDAQNALDEAELARFQAKLGLTSNNKQLLDVSEVATKSLLQGLSKGSGVAGAVRGANYAAQAANQYNITIKAQTNASSQDIASDVGWAIRTSSDVQYRVNRADAMGFN